jgi:hypothetical protein
VPTGAAPQFPEERGRIERRLVAVFNLGGLLDSLAARCCELDPTAQSA